MPNRERIWEETRYLFSPDYLADDFDPEETDHCERARALIEKESWKEVFDVWFQYLRENCPTVESVVNFCNLYATYLADLNVIPDPYEFLGYIFYRVGLDKLDEQDDGTLDMIAVNVLEKAGEISLYNDPCCAFWEDPKLLAAIEVWKEREKAKEVGASRDSE